MAFEQQASLATKSVELRQKLNALLAARDSSSNVQSQQIAFDHLTSADLVLLNADVIVTANEVNRRHGTGVLISKIFGNCANIFSIRAHNHYDAEHDFGDLSAVMSVQGLSRKDVFSQVMLTFAECTPRQVICIPFDPDEILISIAIKELFDVPLCMYIMDDNNIYASGIPDSLMREALTKSSLRLAISPELQQAYQQKFNLKFWLLPPVVASELIYTAADTEPKQRNLKTGIIVGNIWGQRWLELLRQTVRNSGITIHWYCNAASKSRWLQFDPAELAQDGIFFRDPLPEPELAEKLREYAFAILPSGIFDSTETENNQAVARLSLPTKVPFITATSNTPIVVLGSRESAAARFVERFNLGIICDYQSSRFQQAIEQITRSDRQTLLRQNAQAIAPIFSDAGIATWILQSLQRGEPVDYRFEQLMPPLKPNGGYYVEPPAPKRIHWGYVSDYQMMRRLRDRGYCPDFVIDVGAAIGAWTNAVNQAFPQTRFILIDPLFSHYNQAKLKYHIQENSNFELVERAISNQTGVLSFRIASGLFSSSLLPMVGANYEVVEVEVTTLDQLAQEKQITGRGILKADVQFAEHLVIEGALNLLPQIDLIQLELTLPKLSDEMKTLLEMTNWLFELGFEYYDEGGNWRSAIDGTLFQKDVLFARKGLFSR